MDNFNKEQQLYCQYCGKECKSINSLIQHEIRCKLNSNKINLSYLNNNKKGIHVGYKWITNGIEQKFIKNDLVDKYINEGWKYGMSDLSKQNISKNHNINKSTGRAKTIEKESERKQKISQSLKGNKNWMFNKTRGNGKKGWYKGIFCDSTWELAYLVYCLENNINIKRCQLKFEYIWNNEKHIYIPDFIINDNELIEIKGRKTKQSEEKHKQFPNIKVIDYELIKPYLEYVKNKYGEEFWKYLYENSG